MSKSNIKTSGFTLAKGKELTGDDFYDVKVKDNLTVAVLCDGVGSALGGAEAAKRVTTHLINNFKNKPNAWSIEKSIKEFIKSINSILYQESITQYERAELVTTLTIVVIDGDRLHGANVGDSRIYIKRDNSLRQLSFDHNEDGMDNVLSNAIGIAPELEIYYFENNIQKDDSILLCSDGLYSIMSDDMLLKNMINGATSLVKKASKLMEENLPDDTSAIVIDILDTDEVSKMKKLPLNIPGKLKKGDEIDGYKLTLSLIQNDRTWVCQKDGVEHIIISGSTADKYIFWNNTGALRYGLNKQQKKVLRKTDDLFEITSNLGYKPEGESDWFYSARFNFKTQLAKGFKDNDREQIISRILAPGYLFLGGGMEYGKNIEALSFYFSPLTLKATFVLDESLANAGAFGVTPAILDDQGNVISKGKRARAEVGILLTNSYDMEITENITAKNLLSLYTDYFNNFGKL